MSISVYVPVYFESILSRRKKEERKTRQKLATVDRLVMKIFRERGRTSRRGTGSFQRYYDRLAVVALQNGAEGSYCFSLCPFFRPSLSFSLSCLSSLRTLFFLPPARVVSVSVRDSTSTLSTLLSSPTRHSFHPRPPLSTFHFATRLSFPPSIHPSRRPPLRFPSALSAPFLHFSIPCSTSPFPSLLSS